MRPSKKAATRAVDPRKTLVTLQQFLKALKTGKMQIKRGGRDFTKQEIEKLKSDITFVKNVLRRQG